MHKRSTGGMMAIRQTNHYSVEVIENLLGTSSEVWLEALVSCRHSRHQATTDSDVGEWLECLGSMVRHGTILCDNLRSHLYPIYWILRNCQNTFFDYPA